jgi:hypothetical protein
MTRNCRPVESKMEDLRTRTISVYVGGNGRLKGVATRWGVRVDREMDIPVPQGFYDVVAMDKDTIHLALNRSDGRRFDPDEKHGYLVRRNRATLRLLLLGAERLVSAVLR